MTFKDSSTKANFSFNELLKETLVIDKFIDHSVFKNIRFIGSGTFGSTYHAVAEMSDIGVALKSFENIDIITAKEILNEINLYKDIIHDNIIKFYGVTKNEGPQYLLVLEYAGDGTITTYLRNTFSKLNWERKLNLAQQLVNGVNFMHEKEIIHGNLKDPIKRPNIQDVVLSFKQLKTESIHNENKAIKNNLFSVNELPATSNIIQSNLDQLTHDNKKLVMEDNNLDLDSLNSKDRAFEGRSTTWILEELCKNPESKLITIDIFLKIFPDNDNETTFHENIKKTRKEDQIEVIKSKSFNTLIKLNHENKMKFDFIYIDGSHESHDVLSDAVLSWNLLKEGGIMILDDYEWDFFEEEYLNPRIAIDSFLICYQTQIEIIDKCYQVAIRKITREGTRTVREGKTID
ncbi:5762_t:CDS:2 [Cetraspora pellucida]|uniref:5762_t:CDS:1 n=1 Tax=Cetraspora pellucida TaxID=1433469 RepID=A0ACA9NFZ7_9GLOM|nr:5762_t:CDS:2 [Cetraspora pellucida]